MRKNELKIYIASPRGFCAGVDRAIEIVKKSITSYNFNNNNLFNRFILSK